jgi:hypothetical protein
MKSSGVNDSSLSSVMAVSLVSQDSTSSSSPSGLA